MIDSKLFPEAMKIIDVLNRNPESFHAINSKKTLGKY